MSVQHKTAHQIIDTMAENTLVWRHITEDLDLTRRLLERK